MKKLSIIREDGATKCPYGLSIISACSSAGNSVSQMQPLNGIDTSKTDEVIQNNKYTHLTQKSDQRCIYANEILEKFNKVDCSFGSGKSDLGTEYLSPSSLYPKIFIGEGAGPGTDNGQDIYDPRLYSDAPEKTIDVPFGMYSIFADRSNELGLLKAADKYTNKIITIRDKISFLRNIYFDTLKLIYQKKASVILDNNQLNELLFIINDWAK